MSARHFRDDVLVRASLAAKRAWNNQLEIGLIDNEVINQFSTLLSHSFYRPLLELELNGCTNLRGARVLVESWLAKPVDYSMVCDWTAQSRFEGLEISKIGRNELRATIEDMGGCKYLPDFKRAIRIYLCIDEGHGICASSGLIRRALADSSQPLLGRLVFVNCGGRQFDTLPPSARASATGGSRTPRGYRDGVYTRILGRPIVDLTDQKQLELLG